MVAVAIFVEEEMGAPIGVALGGACGFRPPLADHGGIRTTPQRLLGGWLCWAPSATPC